MEAQKRSVRKAMRTTSLDILPRGSIAVKRPEGGPYPNRNEDAEPMGGTPPNSQKGEAEAPSPSEKAKARCPECGEELDYLECYTTAKYYYYPDGTFEYVELADGWEEYGDYYFVCPECKAELALSIEEADEILGRKKEEAEEAQEEKADKDE
jgi:predicted RNA-binding Zn-ribbon protein involved in translation (DUF1610 family)